ncbi:MAG: succinate dehydrogenase/fumarate reductase iron-sulfur subunit [Candidatus Dadabacteria bacterium]|nr:MAG: succinate dehydrogenase/fumarate reductase iron-sulfur subunit [Candidatus Dadabacteria bacterium]TDI99230.1 MAG: succinate dehydrogenase/fumarate reductase iron-sulfur subunit [Candidatus Dadabacteria bacterium]
MSVAKLRIYRGDSNGGQEVEYEVPIEEGMVVLDAIFFVQANYAGDLAVRWNCKAGKCGSCSAEINGMPKLTCKTRLDTLPLDKPITVHPLKAFPIMKDLVTDVSWNYEVRKKIPPFQYSQDTDWKMQQIDVERSQEFRKCIECFLCQDVCHILRNHNKKNEFFGPRMMIKIAELEMHPLDTGDRKEILREAAGIGYCNITKCCTDVCPEGIHITDNAIIPLKERVADTYFDPLQWIMNKIKGN